MTFDFISEEEVVEVLTNNSMGGSIRLSSPNDYRFWIKQTISAPYNSSKRKRDLCTYLNWVGCNVEFEGVNFWLSEPSLEILNNKISKLAKQIVTYTNDNKRINNGRGL